MELRPTIGFVEGHNCYVCLSDDLQREVVFLQARDCLHQQHQHVWGHAIRNLLHYHSSAMRKLLSTTLISRPEMSYT